MDDIFNVQVYVLDDVNLDIISDIEEKIINNIAISDEEVDYFLSYLCFKVREKLSLKKSKDILDNKFTNQCDTAQSMIYYYLNELNVFNVPVNTHEVLDGGLGHSFIVAHIQDDYYLLDPTYNQFFDLKKCSSDNFMIRDDSIIIKTPDPGYFVSEYSLEDQKTIKDLLKNGYMKIDNNNIRLYGESFYKTKTGVSEANLKVKNFGVIYLKWFLKSKANVSLSQDLLEASGLLIKPINSKKTVKRV